MADAWFNFYPGPGTTWGQEFSNDLSQLGNWFWNTPFPGTDHTNASDWKGLTDFFKGVASPDGGTGQGSSKGTPPSGGADVNAFLQDLFNKGAAAGTKKGAAGTGGAADPPAGYYTPDGVFINANSEEDVYYRMVDAIWSKLYGRHAPYAMSQTFKSLGVENTSQLDTIMNQMPSHIKNPDGSAMTLGAYNTIKGVGQGFADKYFGRPIPDSLINQWTSKGITDPASIELWFLNHSAKDIPKEVYGQIFDQAKVHASTWNDIPHPDAVAHVYQQMQNPNG